MKTKIDFSNPGHVKLCLLSQGINVSSKKIFDSKKFAENQFPYGYSSELVKKFKKIPSELILDNHVSVGIHLKADSPWTLRYNAEKNETLLFYKEKSGLKVQFNQQPCFYGKSLQNGLMSENVGVMYGPHILSLFSRGWCYFFTKELSCKFCSLKATRNLVGKNNVLTISPNNAAEVTKLALSLDKERILYINHCAGSHKDHDLGVKLQIDILKAIKPLVPPEIRQHMMTMPPNDFRLFKTLRENGLGSLNMAIEVFDKKLFKNICPGKEKFFGYEKFLEAFGAAIKVFSNNTLYANFVGGLESLSSMAMGFEYFGKKGVAPSINVFHPDPKSVFYKKPRPSIEYLFEMVKAQSEIYSKYNFKPIFPIGGTRNSLDTEVYLNYFN